MRWLGLLIAGLALGWVGLVAVLALVQRQLQYEPGTGPLPSPATTGVAGLRALSLHPADGSGVRLTAWAAPPPGNPFAEGTTLVFFHGNAGTIADRIDRARMVQGWGLGVMLVEWRGYGGNPGRPSEAGLLADGRAALAWLAAQGCPPDRVVLYGESLGSGVALILGAEAAAAGSPPGAVILDGGFTSAVDVARRRYPFAPVGWLMKDRFEGLAALARLPAPLLVMHGEADPIVPVAMGRRLEAAAPGPAEGFYPPRGGHVDLYDHGAEPVVRAFLARHGLAPPQPDPTPPALPAR